MNENKIGTYIPPSSDLFTLKVQIQMLRFIAIAFFAVSVTLLIQRDNLQRTYNSLKTKNLIAETGLKICSKLLVDQDQEIHDAKGCE